MPVQFELTDEGDKQTAGGGRYGKRDLKPPKPTRRTRAQRAGQTWGAP